MTPLTTTREKKLLYVFAAVWLLANVVLAWLIAVGQVSFTSSSMWIALLILIPCIVVLMRLIRNPIRDEPTGPKTVKGKLVGLIVVVIIAVLCLQAVLGKFILFTLPVVAAGVLLVLKPKLDKQEWLYASFLALIAGVGGSAQNGLHSSRLSSGASCRCR
jgi:hypothetical protein